MEVLLVGDCLSSDFTLVQKEAKENQSTTLDTTVYQALTLMDREGLSALPVLNELGALEGVVTQQNIVAALSRHETGYIYEIQSLNFHIEELVRNASTRIKRLNQLEEINRGLLASLGLTIFETNTLQMSIEALTILMRVRYGAIGILDQKDKSGKNLKYFVHTGMLPQVVKAIGKPPIGRGLLGTVIKENSSLRLEDMSKDPRSVGFPANHPPMKSLLAVPISVDNNAYGQIYLSEKLNGLPFTEEDVLLCQNFSTSLASGLDRLAHFEPHLEEIPNLIDLTSNPRSSP